jgi:hypothetical protein
MADQTSKKRGRPPKKPFEVGNPGGPGRPKTDPEIKAMFKAATPEAAEYLIGLIRNAKSRPADRIRACEIIFDRGYGKPAQEVQITGDRTFNIVFDPILKEELDILQ